MAESKWTRHEVQFRGVPNAAHRCGLGTGRMCEGLSVTCALVSFTLALHMTLDVAEALSPNKSNISVYSGNGLSL